MQVHLEQEWLQLFDHTQRSCHFECGRLNCLETWQYRCLELALLWIHNTVPRDRCHLHFECPSNSWRVTVRFSSPYCNHPLQRCYTPGYDKKKKTDRNGQRYLISLPVWKVCRLSCPKHHFWECKMSLGTRLHHRASSSRRTYGRATRSYVSIVLSEHPACIRNSIYARWGWTNSILFS